MVDFFKGFNPSGQGTMFGGNQSNSSTDFYDFLANKKTLKLDSWSDSGIDFKSILSHLYILFSNEMLSLLII